MYGLTEGTKKILSLKKRIRGIAGGTAASKTISILLTLIDMAQADTVPTLTSITSESLPHLRRGAMRDFLNIMNAHGYYEEKEWNRTDKIYTFPNGSVFEFFGVEKAGKVKGARRQRLFINECNNVSFDIFEQLEPRTEELIFLDWNPSEEFWFYEEVLEKRKEDVDFITLTYLDNNFLSPNVVKAIEARKQNTAWWKVYGLGQLGEIDSRIYTGWGFVDEIPEDARLERYGLDFGYSVDPTAIVENYRLGNSRYFRQIVYQKKMSNRQIADVFEFLPKANIIADSEEAKSIAELKSYGLAILPSRKGPDSVRNGISRVQNEKIYVTKDSLDLIKEYRTYLWEVDATGKNTLKPSKKSQRHLLDALRYSMEGLGESNLEFNRALASLQDRAWTGELY